MTPRPWTPTGSKKLLRTRIFDVEERGYRRPGGGEGKFVVLDAPDWVNVLALTPERRLVVVRQFRFGTAALSWEIPGGVMEPGEEPVSAGARELREETGLSAPAPRLLASVSPNPAFLANTHHIVLAENAAPDPRGLSWDPDEEIETRAIPLGEADAWVRDGRIRHSLVLAALLHLRLAGLV
ncbi:MAG: NUDIX hydrolase [Opitutaceae bacterium]|jgi:8-oxo-dGTP pyrophosphatase MutT (NUDIX family)|nr:NUDIX hydrolase [Opitutaceae bacterium]